MGKSAFHVKSCFPVTVNMNNWGIHSSSNHSFCSMLRSGCCWYAHVTVYCYPSYLRTINLAVPQPSTPAQLHSTLLCVLSSWNLRHVDGGGTALQGTEWQSCIETVVEDRARQDERRRGGDKPRRALERQKGAGSQIKKEVCVCISLDCAAPQGTCLYWYIDGLVAEPPHQLYFSSLWRPLIRWRPVHVWFVFFYNQ